MLTNLIEKIDAVDRYAFVKGMLQRYKSVTMDLLLDYLPDREPRRHLYDLVPLYPLRSGKGFRPGLLIATGKAFGAEVRNLTKSAMAIELFHNAFLVHDDVEDDSDFRRGGATLHADHGFSIAVNVGDAMNVLSLRPLMENLSSLGPSLTLKIFSEIEHMVRQSVEGQAIELGWVRDNVCDLTDEDYLRMILKKTCWYTCIHPCRIGALIATGGGIEMDRFNRFGFYMGAAFQIQDDILNLEGDREKYGKEILGDIWEGKRTMMLLHLLNCCGDRQRKILTQFLAQPRRQRKEDEVLWVHELMKKHESLAYARSCARQLAGAALREFNVAYGGVPDSEDKRFIQSIVLYMIERDL